MKISQSLLQFHIRIWYVSNKIHQKSKETTTMTYVLRMGAISRAQISSNKTYVPF